ncbi:hypothetical protein BJ508DRAFT_195448, partial [Ascobolus immersus RN42]
RSSLSPPDTERQASDSTIKPNTITTTTSIASGLLVVDDNPVNLRIIIRILDSSGFTTVSAQNGQEALCILSNRSTLNSATAVAAGTGSLHESPIDLIIMDMAMPVMSGLDAAKEIRRRESVTIQKKKNRRIPIIGLSGHLQDSYAKRAIESGMDEYITKPFRKNDLLEAIE